jgi:hypothetical protein
MLTKNKEALREEMLKKEKIKKQKEVAQKVFMIIEGLKTVYDSQTVFNAVSGFIKEQLAKKEMELTVKDLTIDLSKEKVSPLKTAVVGILGLIADDNAHDTAILLETMANKLPQF